VHFHAIEGYAYAPHRYLDVQYIAPTVEWVPNNTTYKVLATVRLMMKFFWDVKPLYWGSRFTLKMEALRNLETSNYLYSDTTSHLRRLWPLEQNASRPSLFLSTSAFKQHLNKSNKMRAKRIISNFKSAVTCFMRDTRLSQQRCWRYKRTLSCWVNASPTLRTNQISSPLKLSRQQNLIKFSRQTAV